MEERRTVAGTVMVKDIFPVSIAQSQLIFASVNGRCFLTRIMARAAMSVEERRHDRRHRAGQGYLPAAILSRSSRPM